MIEQLTHKETSFQQKVFPIILLLDNITGEANLGSLFRLADAFGIEKIIFCGTLPNLNSNRLKRTARNTFKTVNSEFHKDSTSALKLLKEQDYKALALEITDSSIPMQNLDLDRPKNMVLIAGNERHGISDEVLKLCDEFHHIEMFGKNSSMNVAQSVGIALYEITKAFNKFAKK